MSCVIWYKTGQWHKDSVAVANRGISKDFWRRLISNIPPLSALSTSCVWFWSPCRSWCPDTRHTASAPETASRPASSRNGRGWWPHQVGRQHAWMHTPTQTHTISGMCNFCYSPLCSAEPSRQAPNKRRKRKMSGGSTISGGGGTNNNNNNKKKSPGTGFPLSSQVPVRTTLLSSVSTLPLHS